MAKTEPVIEREVPAIKPGDVQRNNEGFAYQTYFVRLPAGMIAQDLQDHPDRVWHLVQDNRNTALRKFDRVTCVAFDESFMVDAVVGLAEAGRVVLSGFKKTDLPAKSGAFYEDDNYKTDWAGNGYGVFRKSDGVRMVPESFTLPEQAKIALLALYGSKRAA